MNNKKETKTKSVVKTMNFPLPQEEFEKLMTDKISEVKEDIIKLENLDNSNIIQIDFKNRKRID